MASVSALSSFCGTFLRFQSLIAVRHQTTPGKEMYSRMKHFTTSFNPTGNRLIEECVVPSEGKVTRTVQVFASPSDNNLAIPVWAVGSASTSSQFVVSFNNLTVNRYDFDSDRVGNETFLLQDSPNRPLLASLSHDDNDTNAPSSTLIPTLQYPPLTSDYSTAIPLEDGGWFFITRAQNLQQIRSNGNDVTSLSLSNVDKPLIDANIVYSQTNRLWAVYTGATEDRYVHGVLGDDQEASSLHILQYDESLQLVNSIQKLALEGDDLVFEGLGPMWADVNGDGIDDLITTISASRQGSALGVYLLSNATDGTLEVTKFVTSDFIGTGGRWLHQIAAGPLGPNGGIEIVEIRTPHLGGQVRYYRLPSDDTSSQLEFIAETQLYTSHELGSRNLDAVTVGDFDGDGVPELVVQDQDRKGLYGLQRTSCGVNVAWNVTLPSKLETNIAVSCNIDTSIMNILFATQESFIRLEFAPTSGDTTGLGAVAACMEAGGSSSTEDENGGENGGDSSSTDTSDAFAQCSNNFLFMTMLCIFLTRWLLRS